MASTHWGLRALCLKSTLQSYSSFPSSLSAHPPQPYTLAEPSPYIIHDESSGQLPSHHPLDFELYRTFFNAEEQSIWMRFLLSTLDRAHPCRSQRQSRQHTQSGGGDPVIQADGFEPAETYDFEAGHFNTVITDYREHEIRALDRISDSSIQPLLACLAALFPPQSSLLAHILHLSPSGKIDSHLDHTSASGPTIVALSLGGAHVLHLLANEKATKPVYKVLLKPGSVYLQRHSVCYSLPHAIPAVDDFAAKAIGGSHRLSLILRVCAFGGVYIEYEELKGRAKWGANMEDDGQDRDANGNGSHCAGTIASRAYGVAKNATIIAVKVLGAGGSGSMLDVITGVVWAAEAASTKAAEEAKKNDSKHKGTVANMSLGGGKSPSLDQAVDSAVMTGLHFAVAADNDNRDACQFSPASARLPITVGAPTIADDGPRSLNTISGTSMASPHIAGLAAYFLSIYPHVLNLAELGLTEQDEDDFVSSTGQAYDLNQYLSWGSFSQRGQIAFGKFREAVGFGNPKPKTTGFKPMSSKTLKKAMIKLSTHGVLTSLPSETVNYLAFNNATRS